MWSCASRWITSSAARCFSAPTIRAEEAAGASELFHLTGSKAEDIDVVMKVDEVDVEKQQQALDCYVTYRGTIEQSEVRRNIRREAGQPVVIYRPVVCQAATRGVACLCAKYC